METAIIKGTKSVARLGLSILFDGRQCPENIPPEACQTIELSAPGK
jgi:hypothetical protein